MTRVPGAPPIRTEVFSQDNANQIRADMQFALNKMARESQNLRSIYAKSNTLATGMMTAGRVLFPELHLPLAEGYKIVFSIGGKRFIYDNARVARSPGSH